MATRPEARIGSDEVWDKAEHALIESLRRSGCEFEISPGEGAFYGPKIEYTLKDAIGRPVAVRHDAGRFLDGRAARCGICRPRAGERLHPVMLHRAIVGSLERFIGILIEQHAGALPAWLAPQQVSVLNISEAAGRLRRRSGENASKTRA